MVFFLFDPFFFFFVILGVVLAENEGEGGESTARSSSSRCCCSCPPSSAAAAPAGGSPSLLGEERQRQVLEGVVESLERASAAAAAAEEEEEKAKKRRQGAAEASSPPRVSLATPLTGNDEKADPVADKDAKEAGGRGLLSPSSSSKDEEEGVRSDKGNVNRRLGREKEGSGEKKEEKKKSDDDKTTAVEPDLASSSSSSECRGERDSLGARRSKPNASETPRMTVPTRARGGGGGGGRGGEQEEEEEEDLLFARLTGAAYTLNSRSTMKRIWADEKLAALALKTLLLVFEIKVRSSFSLAKRHRREETKSLSFLDSGCTKARWISVSVGLTNCGVPLSSDPFFAK